MRISILTVAIGLIVAACGGDEHGGSSACPDLDGASRDELEEVFGRPADHVDENGDHFWYFADDDQIVVTFRGGTTEGFAIHDGDQLYSGRPPCPLPDPEDDHPARFNIEEDL